MDVNAKVRSLPVSSIMLNVDGQRDISVLQLAIIIKVYFGKVHQGDLVFSLQGNVPRGILRQYQMSLGQAATKCPSFNRHTDMADINPLQ